MILAGGEEPFRSEIVYQGRTLNQIARDAMAHLNPPLTIGGKSPDQPGGKTFLESFQRGLEAAPTDWVLMASADMPFLGRDAVDDFLGRCLPDAAVFYSVCRVEDCEKQYPGLKRTALKLAEGTMTGGNLFLLHRPRVLAALPRIEALYQNRKNPGKLAQTLGFGTILLMIRLKFGLGQVRIADFENRIGNILRAPVRAIPSPHASLATDIDNSSQIAWLEALKMSEQTTDI